jgi:CDP-6-deoxy-D-xylo-4-hexulose-3-dehydrase
MSKPFTRGIFRIAFPFAEGGSFKKRPALALTEPDEYGDIHWAFISTKPGASACSIELNPADLAEGSLPQKSFLHYDKTFTINQNRIISLYGRVSESFWTSFLKRSILRETRKFSRLTHTANRPGNDALREENAEKLKTEKLKKEDILESSSPISASQHLSLSAPRISVPYAGRVFTEDEVEAAVSATLDFWLTLGPEGEAFEKELAAFLGVKHSLLVNSGSSANLIALSCLTTHKLPDHKRIRPGDEVITCAAGFPTTVAPIVQNGCIPVFIDNDPTTGNARVEQLEAAYSPGKTKAVMMAHTLGNPFNIAAVLAFCKKYDLWLIEDNCDALGCTYTMPVEMARELGLDHLLRLAEEKSEKRKAKSENLSEQEVSAFGSQLSPFPRIQNGLLTAYTGSFGDLSTQSFYPPHHLTMGEGGAVNIIRRPPLKTYAESFRDWGRDCWCPSGKDNTCGKRFGWNLGELPTGYDHKYIYSHLGYNLKPLDPQAAIGRVQLKRLPAFIQARKENWEILRRGLADLEKYFDFSLPTHAVAWENAEKLKTEKLKEEVISAPAVSASQHFSVSAFSWDSSQCRTDCSWFGFMLRVKPSAPFTVREFAAYLDEHKIGNRMLFGGNLLRQPVFVQLRKDNPNAFRVVGEGKAESGKLKEETPELKNEEPRTKNQEQISASQHRSISESLIGADSIMHTAIFLGTYPGLSRTQLDYEIAVIREFVDTRSKNSQG